MYVSRWNQTQTGLVLKSLTRSSKCKVYKEIVHTRDSNTTTLFHHLKHKAQYNTSRETRRDVEATSSKASSKIPSTCQCFCSFHTVWYSERTVERINRCSGVLPRERHVTTKLWRRQGSTGWSIKYMLGRRCPQGSIFPRQPSLRCMKSAMMGSKQCCLQWSFLLQTDMWSSWATELH